MILSGRAKITVNSVSAFSTQHHLNTLVPARLLFVFSHPKKAGHNKKDGPCATASGAQRQQRL